MRLAIVHATINIQTFGTCSAFNTWNHNLFYGDYIMSENFTKSTRHNPFAGKSRKIILILFDMFCFVLADLVYFFLCKEVSFSTPVDDVGVYIFNSVILLVCLFLFRFIFRIYSNVWRYPNTDAYFRMIISDAFGALLTFVASRFVINSVVFQLYIGIWHCLTVTSLSLLMALSSRFAYRLLYKKHNKMDRRNDINIQQINIAIAGAGQLGAYLASELQDNPYSKYNPVCFLDVDKAKIGSKVAGLPVYSSEKDEQSVIQNWGITEVVIAINGISGDKAEKFYNKYSSFGCTVKMYDSPIHDGNNFDIKDDNSKRRVVRDFTVEDFLFRKTISIGDKSVTDYYRGKVVLVTGGGGSIGSEICRQMAKCKPAKLIIFDIYENNAYDIQQELRRKYADTLNLEVEIGSVRDVDRLDSVFNYYKPNVVFHAAAHKHVPLMEHSSAEAIKNNVFGTYNTANMAEKYGVEKFILVSTDKAVNPTNVMGASKRMCEMVIQCRTNSKTCFAAVRFGNVLGSNGSVIPLFKRQIAEGGPVTITDKRIIRYFMTIPEASSLVIQAGAMAKKGELFVLDMGKPVKIYDLAFNMIKLMGFEPEKDIKIEEIGLRPGEKLYEELLMKTEALSKTDNNMIFIEKDSPLTREEVEQKLLILRQAVEQTKNKIASPAIKAAMKQVVPTFVDPEEVNKNAQDSAEMKMIN